MAEEKEQKELTKQEENWMLMTTLQIPWKDANAIDDEEDRAFLLDKVREVQKYMQGQEAMMQNQQMMQQQQPPNKGSGIITPEDIMQGRA